VALLRSHFSARQLRGCQLGKMVIKQPSLETAIEAELRIIVRSGSEALQVIVVTTRRRQC